MGNEEQDWRYKEYQYHGSKRWYYCGSAVGSTAAYAWWGFSGTNTGIGTAGNEVCNRLAMVGSSSSYIQFSWDGTILAGEIYGTNNAVVLDGVMRSGLYIRSNAASQKVRVWAW